MDDQSWQRYTHAASPFTGSAADWDEMDSVH